MPVKGAPCAHPTKKVSKDAPLTVAGLGVCCQAGNAPFALLGAAALPLALVLGCARFEFAHPAVGCVMVCETGDFVSRGAVLLTPSSA